MVAKHDSLMTKPITSPKTNYLGALGLEARVHCVNMIRSCRPSRMRTLTRPTTRSRSTACVPAAWKLPARTCSSAWSPSRHFTKSWLLLQFFLLSLILFSSRVWIFWFVAACADALGAFASLFAGDRWPTEARWLTALPYCQGTAGLARSESRSSRSYVP